MDTSTAPSPEHRVSRNQWAGRQIRVRRDDELHLTQEQVRARVGITSQEQSRIELGQTMWPSMDTLVRLGSVLGWEPEEMAELYGYYTPKTRPEYPELADLAKMLDRVSPLERRVLLGQVELIRRQAQELQSA